VSAAHAENEHFTYDIVSAPATKFQGNSLEVYPKGEQPCLAGLIAVRVVLRGTTASLTAVAISVQCCHCQLQQGVLVTVCSGVHLHFSTCH
jgi:hypothetical protein